MGSEKVEIAQTAKKKRVAAAFQQKKNSKSGS